jgi:hypothetical protein
MGWFTVRSMTGVPRSRRHAALQAGNLDHKVEVIGRARQEGVRFTRLDNDDVPLRQENGFALDTYLSRSTRCQVYLGDPPVEVWLIKPRIGKPNRNVEVRVPRSPIPVLAENTQLL